MSPRNQSRNLNWNLFLSVEPRRGNYSIFKTFTNLTLIVWWCTFLFPISYALCRQNSLHTHNSNWVARGEKKTHWTSINYSIIAIHCLKLERQKKREKKPLEDGKTWARKRERSISRAAQKKKPQRTKRSIITNVFISKCNFNETPLLLIISIAMLLFRFDESPIPLLLLFASSFFISSCLLWRWFRWIVHRYTVPLYVKCSLEKTWFPTPIAKQYRFFLHLRNFRFFFLVFHSGHLATSSGFFSNSEWSETEKLWKLAIELFWLFVDSEPNTSIFVFFRGQQNRQEKEKCPRNGKYLCVTEQTSNEIITASRQTKKLNYL